MTYKPNPGIVHTKLCGLDVLIPTRAAFDSCQQIVSLPPLWAAAWDSLSTGNPLDNLIKAMMILTKKSDGEIRPIFEGFCRDMAAKGLMQEARSLDPDPDQSPIQDQNEGPGQAVSADRNPDVLDPAVAEPGPRTEQPIRRENRQEAMERGEAQ